MDFLKIKVAIEEGSIGVPQFQRGFVWDLKKSAALLDSVIKEYPIGSITLWKTTENLPTLRTIGNLKFTKAKPGTQIYHIIDGQQRVTSLYAILEGVKIANKNGKTTNYGNVYVDLDANLNEKIVVLDKERRPEGEVKRYIKLHELLEQKFSLIKEYTEQKQEKIQQYRDNIRIFNLPEIELSSDADIDFVIEVFTRLNTSGTSLSPFEVMTAKTYDEERDFDLSKKYKKLSADLGDWKIPSSTVLQVISIFLSDKDELRQCSRKAIFLLEKDAFINMWDDAVRCIETTIDFFKSHYNILISKILPYDGLIVVFAYYFFQKGKGTDAPTSKEAEYLKELFWRIAIAERYKEGLESKISHDVDRVDDILEGKRPSYDWSVDTSPQRIIDDGAFKTSRSFIKTILAVYAAQYPKNFKSGGNITLDKKPLDKKNKINYHHFFPKIFLEKQKEDPFRIDHILNITIITERLNKSDINKRAPSDYLSAFEKENPNLKTHLKTHLINWDEDKVLNDDYNIFFNNRAKRISEELKELIKVDGD